MGQKHLMICINASFVTGGPRAIYHEGQIFKTLLKMRKSKENSPTLKYSALGQASGAPGLVSVT